MQRLDVNRAAPLFSLALVVLPSRPAMAQSDQVERKMRENLLVTAILDCTATTNPFAGNPVEESIIRVVGNWLRSDKVAADVKQGSVDCVFRLASTLAQRGGGLSPDEATDLYRLSLAAKALLSYQKKYRIDPSSSVVPNFIAAATGLLRDSAGLSSVPKIGTPEYDSLAVRVQTENVLLSVVLTLGTVGVEGATKQLDASQCSQLVSLALHSVTTRLAFCKDIVNGLTGRPDAEKEKLYSTDPVFAGLLLQLPLFFKLPWKEVAKDPGGKQALVDFEKGIWEIFRYCTANDTGCDALSRAALTAAEAIRTLCREVSGVNVREKIDRLMTVLKPDTLPAMTAKGRSFVRAFIVHFLVTPPFMENLTTDDIVTFFGALETELKEREKDPPPPGEVCLSREQEYFFFTWVNNQLTRPGMTAADRERTVKRLTDACQAVVRTAISTGQPDVAKSMRFALDALGS